MDKAEQTVNNVFKSFVDEAVVLIDSDRDCNLKERCHFWALQSLSIQSEELQAITPHREPVLSSGTNVTDTFYRYISIYESSEPSDENFVNSVLLLAKKNTNLSSHHGINPEKFLSQVKMT